MSANGLFSYNLNEFKAEIRKLFDDETNSLSPQSASVILHLYWKSTMCFQLVALSLFIDLIRTKGSAGETLLGQLCGWDRHTSSCHHPVLIATIRVDLNATI